MAARVNFAVGKSMYSWRERRLQRSAEGPGDAGMGNP